MNELRINLSLYWGKECNRTPTQLLVINFFFFLSVSLQGAHAAVGNVRPVSGHEAGEPGVCAIAANLRRVPLHEGPPASQHR